MEEGSVAEVDEERERERKKDSLNAHGIELSCA